MQRARTHFALALASCALLAPGCSSTRPRVRAPAALDAALEYGPGSLVGGQHASVAPAPAPATEPTSRPAGLALRCTAWWLAQAPREDAQPLAAHARLVLAPLAAEPFRMSSSLAPGARHADAAASARWLAGEAELGSSAAAARELGRFDLVLLAGQIARIELREPEADFALAALELAVDGDGNAQAVLEIASARPNRSALRERLLLEGVFAPEETLSALFAPLALEGARGWGCAFSIERGAALGEAQALAAERIARSAARSPQRGPQRADPNAQAAFELRTAALAGLAAPHERRHALLALAEQAQAGFARELAQSADQELLASWAERVQGRSAEETEPAAFTWAFERDAWLCALEFSASGRPASEAEGNPSGSSPARGSTRASESSAAADARADGERANEAWRGSRGSRGDSPAAQRSLMQSEAAMGLLLRHAGEAARVEGLLAELLESCSSSAELQARLLEENLYALEDSSPAARVRAYDWLALRGGQPPGYDPLAGREARRAAWLAAERAREEALDATADSAADPATVFDEPVQRTPASAPATQPVPAEQQP